MRYGLLSKNEYLTQFTFISLAPTAVYCFADKQQIPQVWSL